MTFHKVGIAAGIALLAAVSASADIFNLTATGTWVTACPAVYCTATGDSWTYSFDFDTSYSQNPALPFLDSSFIEYTYDIQLFDNSNVVFSNIPRDYEGAYFINPAGPSNALGELNDPYVGVALFTGADSLYQVGTEFNPVFNTGSFPITEAIIENVNTGDVSGITLTDLSASSAPEPSAWTLVLAGVPFLWWCRNRKRPSGAALKR